MSVVPLRGQVFRVDLGHGAKPWVIVSNNARNRNLETVLAARITTTGKHASLPTVVAFVIGGPVGRLRGGGRLDSAVPGRADGRSRGPDRDDDERSQRGDPHRFALAGVSWIS